MPELHTEPLAVVCFTKFHTFQACFFDILASCGPKLGWRRKPVSGALPLRPMTICIMIASAFLSCISNPVAVPEDMLDLQDLPKYLFLSGLALASANLPTASQVCTILSSLLQ